MCLLFNYLRPLFKQLFINVTLLLAKVLSQIVSDQTIERPIKYLYTFISILNPAKYCQRGKIGAKVRGYLLESQRSTLLIVTYCRLNLNN